MEPVIKAEHLRKFYGDTPAMDDISFTVEKGSIVGLIGPNGAGKTSTLKAILGLTSFAGSLEVLGKDPRLNRDQLMEEVCFIADVGVLPKWLRVANAIDYIEGVHPRFSRERAMVLLGETSIGMDKKVSELSKGMVTQLHLALILAIDVKLLVLDEPTLGLDILYQKSFFDRLLNDYFDNETSIIISTHQVEEVKTILTHLMFIDEGKIRLDMPMETVSETFFEVLVAADQRDAAMALHPVSVRKVLGNQSMLFENVAREKLQALGEVHVPAISDLFVAKIRQTRGVSS